MNAEMKVHPRKYFAQEHARGHGNLIFTCIILSLVGSFMVVPRPTVPQILPLPPIDREHRDRVEKQQYALAKSARAGSLSNSVRAVGEQIRRLGRREAQGKPSSSAQSKALQDDVKQLVKEGKTQPLLVLRALQAELFVQATMRWLKQPNLQLVPPELLELGGLFSRAARNSWLEQTGALRLARHELRLFFRLRWGRLTGVHAIEAFRPSLEEIRRYYLSNLKYPLVHSNDPASQTMARISYARSLSKVDPDYPGGLAIGILQLRLNQFEAAERSLNDFLQQRPDGAWVQLAKNHLQLAIRYAPSETAPFH